MRNSFLLLTLLSISACKIKESTQATVSTPPPNVDPRLLSSGKNLERFESCRPLEKYINESLNQRFKRYPIAEDLMAAPTAGASNQITNVQEAGVDESDIVKASDSQLFYVVGDEIKVINRSDFKLAGSIKVNANRISLYLDNNNLIAIGHKNSSIFVDLPGVASPAALSSRALSPPIDDYVYQKPQSFLAVYKLSESALPILQKEWIWDGSIQHTRLKDGILTLALSDYLPFRYSNEMTPLQISGDSYQGIKCVDYFMPTSEDYSTDVTKLFAMNLRASEIAVSDPIALMGFSTELYASERNLYIIKNHYGAFGFFPTDEKKWNQSSIVKLPWPRADKLKLESQSIIKIQGNVQSRYWLSEKDNSTLLAVTSDHYQQTHNLYALDTSGVEMKVLDSYSDFGAKEDIKAVRFVDTKAYVVTFRRVDPLYAFDVSIPTDIRKLGELKIPGFSTYLHSMGDNMLVGLGYDVPEDQNRIDGVKLSLFDVASDAPTELDNVKVGESGNYVSSDAIYNPHAFFANVTTKTVAFPVTEYNYTNSIYNGQSYAVIYQIKNSELHLAAKITHSDLIEPLVNTYLNNIQRIFLLDGSWISLSNAGMKVSTEASPDTTAASLRF